MESSDSGAPAIDRDRGNINSATPIDPPYSRLFVVCGKDRTVEDLRSIFEEFGEIEDLFLVKDRQTGEKKGVCFVKYKLSSSAALAQEELHDTISGSGSRPLRVMIAVCKSKQTDYDVNNENSRNRLFVMLPKGSTEQELRDAFSDFAGYETSYVVQDKRTGGPKGIAYVKFARASSAALAAENCSSVYHALIAEPKDRGSSSSNGGRGDRGSYGDSLHPPSLSSSRGRSASEQANASGASRLYVVLSTDVTQEQLASLCNMAPGMCKCDLKVVHGSGESRGFAFVTYTTPGSAQFAKDRLGSVEYPPGRKLVVKYANDHPQASRESARGWGPGHESEQPYYGADGHAPPPPPSQYGGDYDYDRRAAGTAYPAVSPHYGYTEHRNAALVAPMLPPAPQYDGEYHRPPVANSSQDEWPAQPAPGAAALPGRSSSGNGRVFFVGTPAAPPDSALRSVFDQFGGFVDAYVVRGHNYGYARYEDGATAERAIAHLNGSEVFGNRLKVMTAKPPPSDSEEPQAKRMRT